ncbi:phosphatidylserine decarboxylase [Clostridium tyrobutyricum]|jgi:phosphatidylserine decarboxylase|uniref:Phosphatidylserine decarboxylase proenzyme n=1 Tax=Clostridium tyrobutyricum DIVETGP TaxID=1408889 RepID=W6N4F6_CLOTY|nr:phosphatidylserine decarboxylase [Clostridium tyrobutyricum]AND83290.1 phosphatidylserine decarboxylase [Clostridium tyrobutyricum]ANP70805.1 phosphatidylserine decarboxylase [Clostridium tyrobutyricum]MBR9648285.1 phosphatidylserine decarboxylase [Clostridium tyrobutyricum]MBV4417046.1 phosphatidylserine decarboxylase [Clostridium tyrobutyricum]MBV4423188.1 phosphatidylserine decarboxylase [Clostridium tyrobutyricum]
MIKYYNRRSKKYEIEHIAGDKYLKWIYSSPIGMKLLELIVKKKVFSKLYGYFCNTGLSRRKIYTFIKDFNIDMEESIDNIYDFKSFNDFFTRKLKKSARPTDKNSNILISPGDGRVLAYSNIDLNKLIQVKGYTYKLYDLIENKNIAEKFKSGNLIILRLAPVDYHRFHFIDNGTCSISHRIKGDYYSVNPISLKKIPEVFCKNERQWSILNSENFGDVLYVEIGATCVGSIVQTYTPQHKIYKGYEKGYFKFGGSTIILFFEKDKIAIDKDIIYQTNIGYETKVIMGEKIGTKYKL